MFCRRQPRRYDCCNYLKSATILLQESHDTNLTAWVAYERGIRKFCHEASATLWHDKLTEKWVFLTCFNTLTESYREMKQMVFTAASWNSPSQQGNNSCLFWDPYICSDVLLVLFYRCVHGWLFCILLFNSVSYVFLWSRLCIYWYVRSVL